MIKPILRWPNPILKRSCVSCDLTVPNCQKAVLGLVEDLRDTLEASGGVGLAANQIGEALRVVAIASTQQGFKPFVNPEVVSYAKWEEMAEGCLSVPGVSETVRRARVVVVKYLDPWTGREMLEEFEDEDAHVLQHEIDHINGITFVDKLPPGKRDQIRVFLRKNR